MKIRIISVLCAVLLAGIVNIVNAEETSVLKTQKDRLSYSLGADLGNSLKKQNFEIDPDIFARGLKDSLSGEKLLLTETEIREILMNLQKELMAKQQESLKALAERNKSEGEKFLSENRKKEGVKTLPSGLQYKVIKKRSGKTPKETDMVTVNYRGTLIDGTEFDSSYKRGQPSSFPVRGVIKGWTEALKLMKEGSQWQIVVPSNLAYGESGAGNVIGPNATLIFEIELISINKEKEKK